MTTAHAPNIDAQPEPTPELDATLAALAEARPHVAETLRTANDREAAATGLKALLRDVYAAGFRDGQGHAKKPAVHHAATKGHAHDEEPKSSRKR